MSTKSRKHRHTIYGLMVISFFIGLILSLVMVGCTTPPTPLHIVTGQSTTFMVGGVTFTLTRTSEHFGDITARNTNNNGVRVLAERLDAPGVLMDKLYIPGSGKSDTAPGVVLEIGEVIHLQVRIWKSNIADLATCAFSDESCYLSSDEVTVVLQ